MLVRKNFKFRLRPNCKKRRRCFQFSGARRWVYNRGLAIRSEEWKENQRRVSLYEQNKELTQLKKNEETSWLKDIHSQVLQQSLGDLDLAFQRFFDGIKKGDPVGYPKFRRKGEGDSFRYPQGVKVRGNEVYLPKIGWVRFRKSREILGIIKQTTVILEGNHWYVSFSCEWEQPNGCMPESPSVAGIDMGLEHFAILGDEQGISKYDNPRFLKKKLAKLRFLSRQVSKKVKKSKNRRRAIAKLQAFHAKVRSKRSDFLHQLSTRLVKSHDMIVVESLKVKSLLQKSPKALARAISDAGWRQFLTMLDYKCRYAGKLLVVANEWFPSTKGCSACHKRNEIALSDRVYRCECGLTIHRDDNSALNLRAVGTTVLKACGAALVGGSWEAGILRL